MLSKLFGSTNKMSLPELECMATQAFNKLANMEITHSQHKCLRIYKSKVRSILLYCAETWRANRKIE